MPAYTNEFSEPEYYDHVIHENDGGKRIGTLRIKPVAVLWKPANSHKFYKVSLKKFTEWITDSETGARRTES